MEEIRMYALEALILASLGMVLFVTFVALVIYIIAWWRLFGKAGEPGWKILIPFYGEYVTYKVAWKPIFFWVALGLGVVGGGISVVMPLFAWVISIAGIVLTVLFYINLAKAFNRGGGFVVGLIFLNLIFLLILAFGSSEYVGPGGVAEEKVAFDSTEI
jgi:hypothetical protein